MDINLLSFPSGASQAQGPTIIIDVFRAFTTAAFAFESGAAEIVMVGELDDALALKSSGRADVSIGERGGLKPDGFDFGNSPTAMADADLTGQRLVLTTSNGTAAMVAAMAATARYAGALVNLTASVRAARATKSDILSIVAAGRKGVTKADEDELCASLMRSAAMDLPFDRAALKAFLHSWFLSDAFLAKRRRLGPPSDWELACDVDRFDFAIEVREEQGLLVARRAGG